MRLNLRERVKLLAASYLEACEGSRHELGGGRAPAFASRPPQRGEIWDDGSYWEFERAMTELQQAAPKRHRWFCSVYVARTVQLSALAPHKKHRAEQALSFVVERTKQRGKGNVYVPEEISLNARNYGWKEDFPETEAKSARRPRERRAA